MSSWSISPAAKSSRTGESQGLDMVAMRLDRRTVLRGIGGAVVGLPLLECMLNRVAWAQVAPPRRYALLFAGMALGGDDWAEDTYNLSGQFRTEGGHFIAPAQVGRSYTTTTPLRPLEDGGLRNDFSIVT